MLDELFQFSLIAQLRRSYFSSDCCYKTAHFCFKWIYKQSTNMSKNNYSFQRLSLPINGIDLSRTLSPVAFFHDGISPSEIDLRFNIIGLQRRAQAIATAPRRNRYNDDEEEENNEQKKTLLGYIKTPAVPIPTSTVNQQTQSLPQTQSEISFRVDPPIRKNSDELNYLFNSNSHRNRYSSAPLP